MKLAFINTWFGGGVHHISFPIANALRDMGHEVDYLTMRQIDLDPSFDKSMDKYDLVHFNYFANIQFFARAIEVPFTVGVHHIAEHALERDANLLRIVSPRAIIVPEPHPARQLGHFNITNCKIIPYAFDHSRFHKMPFPEEFAVGYLGCDSSGKRFHIIEEACKLAGVKCVGMDRNTRNEEEGYKPDEDILNFYSQISCYVVAGFNDGGPLPPQEALLCGRPVISTRVGMMPMVIKDHINGLFFDGSATELAEQLKFMKFNFNAFKHGVANYTILPQVEATAREYEKVFKRILEDEE